MSREEPTGGIVRRQLGVDWLGEYPHPTLVMGIVNVTPDSFQNVGRHAEAAMAVGHGLRLAADGADILDVGGESTRPGAVSISEDEEIARVEPVIRALACGCGVPISVDTRKAVVAEAALAAGARIVNDVSAGRFDARMLEVAAAANAFICLMHAPLNLSAMKWSPEEPAADGDIESVVAGFLEERASAARAAGVDAARIWIDPGFGFGKSVAGNLRLLRHLNRVTALPWPVVIGTSRKSTLGTVLGNAPPEDRLEGTLATLALAIASGAAILRVHDVLEAVRVSRVADAVAHRPGPLQAP